MSAAQPRRALVTGSTSGLGRALADVLVNVGFEVLGVDRAAPDAAAFETIACDLANPVAVDAMIVKLARRGPFDRIIFNAGISATGSFEAIPPQAHARLMTVNAEAPMVMCGGLAGAGAIAGGGRVAFVSSLSHFTGYPGAASYAASKDALAAYAKSIRKPYAKNFNVSVSAVYPGPLKTDHAARHAPDGADAEKRMAPAEAARLILAGMDGGKAVIVPGGPARLFAIAGQVAPGFVTKIMKRIIYDRLSGPVW